MALCELHFSSDVLHKAVAAYVILPENAESGKEYPVLYLLHGYSDDHTIWLRRTGIERYAADCDVIVVMPDGGHEFYSNAKSGYDYETFMIEELTAKIESYFPASNLRERRGIAGLSMGGYGAMRLGLKYCEKFVSISAHSGAFDIEELLKDNTKSHIRRVFGDSVKGTDSDMFYLIDTADISSVPAIKFDCGLDDTLLEGSRKVAEALKKRGISYIYNEYPGEHNWAYWDTHIQEALAFHMEKFF